MCFNLTLIYCIPFPWHETHHCNRQAVHVLQIRIPAVNPLCEHSNTPEWQRALSAAAQLAPNPSQIFFFHKMLLMLPSPLLLEVKLNTKYNRLTEGFVLQSKTKLFHCQPLYPKERSQAQRWREAQHHSSHPTYDVGLTEPILDTFRACFLINFCKWIIDSLSWIRVIW